MQRNTQYVKQNDLSNQISEEGRDPTVCESCIGSLTACLIQTNETHATSTGIQINSINIDVEDDIDLLECTSIDRDVRPRAQQFRMNLKNNSNTASKEQINGLYELEKSFRLYLIP
jgi:putative redox protein